MSEVWPSLVYSPDGGDLRAVIARMDFGYPTFSTVSLPDRIWGGVDLGKRVRSIQHGVAERQLRVAVSPAERVSSLLGGGVAYQESRRSLARLEGLWLCCEDHHRLLDAHVIEPLAHQASLVEQVLSQSNLRRVLIADEVGLGKTIEAGLIIQRLRERNSARVLYLTEARLVPNVIEELEKLGLRPRSWSSSLMEARLAGGDSDPFVVGSMHLAVANEARFELIASSGPWDVIVVDEAHHLSDYSPDGSDPRRRMRLVRRLLEDRLVPGGRVILMTATPHQGHLDRYKNLLKLLSGGGETEEDSSGRVVYRLKEDITDWDGQPLFPTRRVHEPSAVHVGDEYRSWLSRIHEVFGKGQLSRAAGWRLAQSLQWSASSPMAGVAYLARFALRRGLRPDEHPPLREAILALRPFRGGPVDEPWVSILGRLNQMARAGLDDDEGDEEDPDPLRDSADLPSLLLALEEGTRLISNDAFAAKLEHVFRRLERSDGGKLVVFAQPVETVWALRDRVEAELGAGSVSIIVGGQRDDERRDQIRRFWEKPGGSRVLVSSRSGGEGINLQVCNQLLHFDIPWNPMEMEQRVGRVHRYGSVEQVHVHTLVLENSREGRVLQRARAKLASIAMAVGWDQERQEQLFGRTMSLVPWEDLAVLMVGEDLGPLSQAEEVRLQTLIQEGFDQWKLHDASFRKTAVRLRSVDRGPLDDEDLEHFLLRQLGAEAAEGWRVQTLKETESGHTRSEYQDIDVLKLEDGTLGHVGPRRGVSFVPPPGEIRWPTRLGLNHPWVAQRIRSLCQGDLDRLPTGAAAVVIPSSEWGSIWSSSIAVASQALVFAVLSRSVDVPSGGEEVGTGVHVYGTADSCEWEYLRGPAASHLIRSLSQGEPSRRSVGERLRAALADEAVLLAGLRDSLFKETGFPTAVFPLCAAVVTIRQPA